jgi:hypothetical protein
MKIFFVSTLFIFISFYTVVAAEITIDASSPGSFEASLSEMANELDEQQQMELVKALMTISYNIDVGDINSKEEATTQNQEEVAKKLNGSEQIEKAIADMNKMGTNAEYQHDADIVRLNDVKLFGRYLQKYYKIKGCYPLQGVSELPVYVYVATK